MIFIRKDPVRREGLEERKRLENTSGLQGGLSLVPMRYWVLRSHLEGQHA